MEGVEKNVRFSTKNSLYFGKARDTAMVAINH